MLECAFKRAWRAFVHSMLCICDAESINSTFVNKNRSAIWNCRCSKTVIPGWDQESDRRTCIVLSWAFVFPLRWDPWSWPGMTDSRHGAFLVDVHFWRHKNIECGCSILFCFFKNVFRKVNTSLACYMNIQKYVRSLLIYEFMHVHNHHSYVLLFFCLNYLLHPALCS